MKTRIVKTLFVISLAACLLFALSVAVSAAESGKCGDNLTWILDNSGTLIISGTGDMYDYSTFDELPWWECKKAVIEKGVTSISDCAFQQCTRLESIEISDSVTSVGEDAFYFCTSLKSIEMPNSVTSVGGGAFYHCESLVSVKLSENIVLIDSGVFNSCTSIESLVIPNSVLMIDEAAFFNCKNLKSVVIPQSVISIAEDAFVLCNNLSILGCPATTAQKYASDNSISFVDISTATPTNAKVLVNGKEISFTAYNIGGNNYFKLRDVAMAINGTSKNFGVGWDAKNKAVTLTSKQGYAPVGGELAVDKSAVKTKPAVSMSKMYVDGELAPFVAFNIKGNNYFKLRDLGKYFDFDIGWDNATKTITVDTNASYTE